MQIKAQNSVWRKSGSPLIRRNFFLLEKQYFYQVSIIKAISVYFPQTPSPLHRIHPSTMQSVSIKQTRLIRKACLYVCVYTVDSSISFNFHTCSPFGRLLNISNALVRMASMELVGVLMGACFMCLLQPASHHCATQAATGESKFKRHPHLVCVCSHVCAACRCRCDKMRFDDIQFICLPISRQRIAF